MRRPIVFVMLAGIVALVAAMVVYSALRKREAAIQQAMVKSVEIAVAARDLPVGTKIGPADVKLTRWSRDDLPPGSFTNSGSLVNQYAKRNIVQSEPIVAASLFGGDKNAGVLPLLIPSGMRAVAVPVDEISDIAGFVRPHARVDVVVSVSSGGAGDKPFSKIVLQNVEVLAAAQEMETVQDKPEVVKVVTLLVTPDQAERLSLASREGVLRLALRNYDDKKIVTTAGVDVAQLLRAYGGPQAPTLIAPQRIEAVPPVPGAPRIKPVEVEVMRNGKSSENISFIRADGAMRQAPVGESWNTSALEGSNKVAATPSDRSQNHQAGLMNDPGTSGDPSADTPAWSGRAAKPEGHSHGTAAIGSSRTAAEGTEIDKFAAPTPKTIDVP